MLMELRENVNKVDTKAFAELRSYNDPPRIVHDILKAVTAIFSFTETEQGLFDDWQQMKGVSPVYCNLKKINIVLLDIGHLMFWEIFFIFLIAKIVFDLLE